MGKGTISSPKIFIKNCCVSRISFSQFRRYRFVIHNPFAMKNTLRPMRTFLLPCSICIAFLLMAAALVAQTSMLPNAFSHNDYRRKRPLSDALDNGFRYVEADVYLRKGKLVVAH